MQAGTSTCMVQNLMTPLSRGLVSLRSSSATRPTVRFLTYNVLAQSYVRPHVMAYCEKKHLRFKYRSAKLEEEIMHYDADIACLQEVDNFNEFYRGMMKRLGFDRYTYVRRDASRKPKPDGCVIFWKSSKFEFVDERQIHFNELAQEEFLANYPAQRKDPQYFLRDNVGAVVVLRPQSGSCPGIVVATCHLHWDPNHNDVKIMQAWMLRRELQAVLQEHDYPLLLGGDFNTRPVDAASAVLRTGQFPPDHPDIYGDLKEVVTGLPAGFPPLRSVCPDEPMTNFTPGFTDVIDYIFVHGTLTPVAALELPKPQAFIAQQITGFPSAEWPSDHVALVADIQVQ